MNENCKILILEDLPTDAELIEREIGKVLEQYSTKIVWIKEDFISALHDFQPDIILSDFYLPGFDGLTALRIARSICPEIPFVVVTGSLNEDTAVECMRSGAWDYVLKEFIKRLGQAILNVLEQARIRKEKIRAQEALVESEERHRSLFEDNRAMMLLIDAATGDIIDANPASCSFYGYTHEELTRMNISQIQTLDQEKLLREKGNGIIPDRVESQYQHILKNGSVRDVEVHGSLIKAYGKKVMHSIIHDITDKKKLEKELVDAKMRAEENDRLKTAFLHNISHEIRTPLNAIVGFSTLLNYQDVSEEKRKEITDIIIMSSEQLLSIITDIISVATLEAGQEKVNIKETDINAELEAVYEQFRVKSAFPNIRLSYHTNIPDSKARVMTDGVKLMQILTNLVGNAMKYTRKGTVEFGCSLRDKELYFFIKDNGIGIPPEFHDKIFDRFWQVDSTITREYGGTGLGLSITKAYVELMGGKIWFDSESGKGSTFHFTLPYEPTMPILPDDSSQKESNVLIPAPGLKILIAEDEIYNYLLVSELLEGNAYKLFHAHNGQEAIDIFQQHPDIQLILMDIKMPVMDGIEATLRIKRLRPEVPIIAITAYSYETDRKRLLERGFDDYLAKPIKQGEFFTRIKKYCG